MPVQFLTAKNQPVQVVHVVKNRLMAIALARAWNRGAPAHRRIAKIVELGGGVVEVR